MVFRVTLVDVSGARIEFAAAPDRSVVRSAAVAGIELTTGCLQGRCRICRAQVRDGEVRPLRRASPNAIDDASWDDGCVLLCAVAPTSDVALAPLSPWRVR